MRIALHFGYFVVEELRNLIKISAIIFTILFYMACERAPKYDDTPRIEFQSLEKYRIIEDFTKAKTDSFIVSIYFEDGDGDLGTNSTDSSIQNYFIDLLRLQNGVYIKYDILDLGRKFPLLAPEEGYIGPLEGTLSLNTKLLHGIDIENPSDPTSLQYGDTIKFTVQIKDRADRLSNLIESYPLIITP